MRRISAALSVYSACLDALELILERHFPRNFLSIGIKASNILQTTSIVVMRYLTSSSDMRSCIEVDRVIESAAPSAAPILPNEP
jgi:hypothetical protein